MVFRSLIVAALAVSFSHASPEYECTFATGLNVVDSSGQIGLGGCNSEIHQSATRLLGVSQNRLYTQNCSEQCNDEGCVGSNTFAKAMELPEFRYSATSGGWQNIQNSGDTIVAGANNIVVSTNGNFDVSIDNTLMSDIAALNIQNGSDFRFNYSGDTPYVIKALYLNSGNNHTVTFEPGTYFIENFGHQAGMNIVVDGVGDGSGVVKLYVKNTLAFNANSKINYDESVAGDAQNPAALLLVSYDQGIYVQGNVHIAAYAYAPNSHAGINAGSTYSGSITAKNVWLQDGVKIYSTATGSCDDSTSNTTSSQSSVASSVSSSSIASVSSSSISSASSSVALSSSSAAPTSSSSISSASSSEAPSSSSSAASQSSAPSVPVVHNDVNSSKDHTLLAWNDLGMHCMDGDDYSVFSILPPYNNLHAQLKDKNGELITAGVEVFYQAYSDDNGVYNTTSMKDKNSNLKTNFWDYVTALFGIPLEDDMGLAGNNTPTHELQSMTFNSAQGWWEAEGIPMTPIDDSGNKNYYPRVKVIAKDGSGNTLADAITVLPVSDEMDCSACHASTSGYTDAIPSAGWVNHAEAQKDYKLNILRLHDDKHPGAVSDHLSELEDMGYSYNSAGLEATQAAGTPILCAVCHSTNALGTTGVNGVPPLTQAIHMNHHHVKDPKNGMRLDDTQNRNSCYSCHPGEETQCLRGAMGHAGVDCQSCHGTMEQVGSSAREGWLDEPNCQSCHQDGKRHTSAINPLTGTLREVIDSGVSFATNPNTPSAGHSLYRYSKGHGGLQCEACHGPTHAIYPSAEPGDNILSERLQGHSGTVGECTACHKTMTSASGGPHGMHFVGQGWVDRHQYSFISKDGDKCSKCHGDSSEGSEFARAWSDRSFELDNGNTKTFAKGDKVTCYSCHNGPNGANTPASSSSSSSAATGSSSSSATVPGTSSSSSDTGSNSSTSGNSSSDTGNTSDVNSCGDTAYGPRSLKLLTREEYQNTLEDLVGIDFDVSESIPFDAVIEGYSNNAFTPVGETHADAYLSVAEKVAEWSKANNYKGVVDCSNLSYDACENRFLNDFATRVFRRPLSAAERTNYASVFATNLTGSDINEGLRLGMTALLSAPQFLYRFEVGTLVSKLQSTSTSDGNEVSVNGADFQTKSTGGADGTGWNIWANGYIQQTLTLSNEALFDISMKGDAAANVWPQMQLIIDGSVVASTTVSTNSYQSYTFDVSGYEGSHNVQIKFTNDLYENGEDRNLYVGSLTLSGVAATSLVDSVDLSTLDSDAYVLSDYEMASFLSYTITGSTPDETLLSAAKNGELATSDQLRAQVARLLATDRAKTHLGVFAAQWLGSDEVLTAQKDAEMFPDFTNDVRVAMAAEAKAFFTHVFYDDTQGFSNLFNADYVMVNNTLSSYYGLGSAGTNSNNPDDFVKVDATAAHRGGLMTLGSFLANDADPTTSSPIKRAADTRIRILCQDIPQPDDTIPDLRIEMMDKVIAELKGKEVTTREFVAKITENAPCNSCHDEIINPLGFSFEDFDSSGRYIQTDHHGLPIDSKGALIGIKDLYDGDVLEMNGGKDLSNQFAQLDTVKECFSANVFRFAMDIGHDAINAANVNMGTLNSDELEDYGCSVNTLGETLKQSDSMAELFTRLGTLDLIRFRKQYEH